MKASEKIREVFQWLHVQGPMRDVDSDIRMLWRQVLRLADGQDNFRMDWSFLKVMMISS
jgi:hypothetical protein